MGNGEQAPVCTGSILLFARTTSVCPLKCHTRMISSNLPVISQTCCRGSGPLRPDPHLEGKLLEWCMAPRGPVRALKPLPEGGGDPSSRWGAGTHQLG